MPTAGFQPLIVPSNVAKIKIDRPDLPSSVIIKSFALVLMFPTIPVGVPSVPAGLDGAGRDGHEIRGPAGGDNRLTHCIFQAGVSGAVVADPPGAGGECNETPGVNKIWISNRRYSRLIRHQIGACVLCRGGGDC